MSPSQYAMKVIRHEETRKYALQLRKKVNRTRPRDESHVEICRQGLKTDIINTLRNLQERQDRMG